MRGLSFWRHGVSLWDGVLSTVAKAIPTVLLSLDPLDAARSVHVMVYVLLAEFHSVGVIHAQSRGEGAGLSEVYELSWVASYPCAPGDYVLENNTVWAFSTETWSEICVLCASPVSLTCS